MLKFKSKFRELPAYQCAYIRDAKVTATLGLVSLRLRGEPQSRSGVSQSRAGLHSASPAKAL